jgi:hypothetical protein
MWLKMKQQESQGIEESKLSASQQRPNPSPQTGLVLFMLKNMDKKI